MSTPPFHFPGHSPHQYTITGNWPGPIAYSNPTTPDATSESNNFFPFDLGDSTAMQRDNSATRGNFYHSKSNSNVSSSYGDHLNPSLYDGAKLHPRSDGLATQALPISHHSQRQSHATQPPSMVVSESARGQFTGHQLNQPVPPHLPSSRSDASFGHSQMFDTDNFGDASLIHTYGTMQLSTAGQFNLNGGGLHRGQPSFESRLYGHSIQDVLQFALQGNQAYAETRQPIPFTDPQTLQALAFASIQQYSRDQPSAPGDGSPSINTPGYTHIENVPRGTVGAFTAGGSYIESQVWPGHSPSLTSTPSLADTSPHLSRSPSIGQTSLVGSISTSTLAPPSLFSQSGADSPSPPATTSPAPSKSTKRTTKQKKVSSPTPSSRRSQSGISSASPAPIASSSIPLHFRVAQLPDKKRRMFEQACGDRWNKSSNTDSTEDEEVERANIIVLEAFYALIGSTELAKQLEIPDDLVKPLLEVELLPKDGGKKGSRGGAAGYKCLWAGCTKEPIKRQDHARNHVREHCGSKPHSCGGSGVKGCGQRFLRMDDLKRHQKSHCSVLRSGPGRRPRSIRGIHHDDSEEDEDYSEESRSTEGGDEDEYHISSCDIVPTTLRERPARLRAQKTPAVRVFSSESSSEGDEENEEPTAGFARHQTSHIRGASHQDTSQDQGGGQMSM